MEFEFLYIVCNNYLLVELKEKMELKQIFVSFKIIKTKEYCPVW